MRHLHAVLAMLTLALCGCVERILTIDSDPPGALVYLNGQEVGRTPLKSEFTWYGNYDVTLRMEGYETLKTSAQVKAPVWQWVPIDLFVEILPFPFTDHQHLSFTLAPTRPDEAQPDQLLDRAGRMRQQLPQTLPPTGD